MKIESQPELKRRKRNRLTVVCQRCRLKKAKCDKKQPCETCSKSKCPELCIYENSTIDKKPSSVSLNSVGISAPQSIESIPQSRMDSLDSESNTPKESTTSSISHVVIETSDFLIGVNPVVRSSNMVNMYMDLTVDSPSSMMSGNEHSFRMFKCYRHSHRPVPFVELSQQEPGSQLYWRYKGKENLKLMTIQNFEPESLRNELAIATRTRFGERYIHSKSEAQSLGITTKDRTIQLSAYGISFGHSFTPETYDNENQLENLRAILPDRHSLLGYVKRFFEVIYPVYPIIDEEWMFGQITRLLRFSPTGELDNVLMMSRDDHVIISILLLVLRLAYLSYFTNVADHNERILRTVRSSFPGAATLENSPVTLTAVSVASEFLERGSKGRKTSLVTLQANIMKCILRLLASDRENGFSILHDNTNCAKLIQMAISLSMERDPDYIAEYSPAGKKLSNLRRKIWYVLVRLDLTMSYLFHCPRSITSEMYNTKLPVFSPSASNIEDLTLEKEVLDSMSEIHSVMEAGCSLLDISLNVKDLFKANDVLQKLTDFEQCIQDVIGTPSEYLSGQRPSKYTSNVLTVSALQTQLILKLFIGNAYYFFYLYYKYRNKSELEYFFLRKVLIIMFVEMNIYSMELMFLKHDIVNSEFFLFMSPVLLLYVHGIAMVGLGLAIRLDCSVIVAESSNHTTSEHVELLKKLTQRNECFVLGKLKLCKFMSERYFYAWKCSKSFGHGYKTIYEAEFYVNYIEELSKTSVSWTTRQQEEMMDLIPSAVPEVVAGVGDISRYTYCSDSSMEDADLKGDDLLKTIQTDHFWICFNTVKESIYSDFPVTEELEIFGAKTQNSVLPEQGTSESSVMRTPLSGDENLDTKLPQSIVPVKDTRYVSNFMDQNPQEIIDFNLFSTDWTIDELFNQHFD
ncbi:Fungal Zn(2)-Cys(6) binuclear cluster domain family protein [Clavispora lusitaniae]|uniref:Fungal Zn(2)-Cys(6) binuclear cluster domain family protein n=1 Tax=Clavispora lusitaniae TaxID=36911 RepID=UPI00202C294C|nr:Fungal Zn(2)-Cys(6) binuclear cluster domain family protein [Clavispora lusitaniae]